MQQVGGSVGTALLNTIAATACRLPTRRTSPAGLPARSRGRRAAVQANAAVHSYTMAFWIAAGGLRRSARSLTAIVLRSGVPQIGRRPRRAGGGLTEEDGDDHAAERTPTARPLRKDAARNRELLIAAAREVFAERGLDASLDDIAHHAGVGVGTAYRHFANKYELAEAIFGEAIDEDRRPGRGRRGRPRTRGRAWSASSRARPQQQTIDRGLREVLTGVHDPEQMDQVSVRLSGPLNHVVARAKKSGQLRDDVAGTDIWLVVMMLCTVADVSADTAPGPVAPLPADAARRPARRRRHPAARPADRRGRAACGDGRAQAAPAPGRAAGRLTRRRSGVEQVVAQRRGVLLGPAVGPQPGRDAAVQPRPPRRAPAPW